MSYDYKTERAKLFTDEGQRAVIVMRDTALRLLGLAGAVRLGELMEHAGLGGDSWFQLACIDRLVELGTIVEVERVKPVFSQNRVFVKGRG